MAASSTTQSPGEAVFRWAVAPRAPLYALVDAARAPDGPRQAEKAAVPFESLLAGPLGAELGSVAPYLVEFRSRSSFGRWWFEQWGNSAGILVETPADLAELRRHFRTLLIVRGEGRQEYYFRFYDPRVLRVFLPKCTTDEAKRFFGPITALYCEGADGKELLTFRPNETGVSIKPSPVPPQRSAGDTGPGAAPRTRPGSTRA